MTIRLTLAATLVCSSILAASDPVRSDLIVHEWGTFLAMNGSDGTTLDGMYHEEHALPPFVHARSRDQLRLRQSNMKGETPVIYFYTPRPTRAYVHVGFPNGLWTQWYPQASMVGPGLAQAGSPPRLRSGRIDWNVDIVPADQATAALPATRADALWNYARDVDAAYVSAIDEGRRSRVREWERFIFYRGLGDARLPVEARVTGGRMVVTTSEPAGVQHVFIARVEEGRGKYAYVPALTARTPLDLALPDMAGAMPLDEFASRIADDMAHRLVESGLFEKEARAMVNTWKTSYFTTDGIRVLFVLPQAWTDRFIPLRIETVPAGTPLRRPLAPAQVVRVMVGRVELLDAARERRAETAIRGLSSPSEDVRERAFDALRAEGRYVEPVIRRALQTTTDAQVRALARRLLLTDFVTELRTALTDAATGEKAQSDPVFVRAQLASLLREVGLDAEARQEGKAALAELERMEPPLMTKHESRHMFRALARAHEGAGDDRAALKWYGAFVEFGSRARTADCSFCHGGEGPGASSFFRDWYAGRKFGAYAVKTGEAARMIAAHEATLAENPSSMASQLGLAYLYEVRGEETKARALWDRITTSP